MRATPFVALVMCVAWAVPAGAYQPAANRVHVKSSTWGRCYAKSIPKERHGSKGTTQVFLVSAKKDKPLQRYDWFAKQIYLQCNMVDKKGQSGFVVIRVSASSDPRSPNADAHALSFYWKGKEVKTYTHATLHGHPGGVKKRFPRIVEVLGFQPMKGNNYAFAVKAGDKVYTFDAVTGEPLKK